MRVRYTAQPSTAYRTRHRSRTGSHRDDGAAAQSAGEQLQASQQTHKDIHGTSEGIPGVPVAGDEEPEMARTVHA